MRRARCTDFNAGRIKVTKGVVWYVQGRLVGTNSVGWIRPGVVVGQSRVSLARPGAVGGKSGTSMGGWWELIFSRLDSSRGGRWA